MNKYTLYKPMGYGAIQLRRANSSDILAVFPSLGNGQYATLRTIQQQAVLAVKIVKLLNKELKSKRTK